MGWVGALRWPSIFNRKRRKIMLSSLLDRVFRISGALAGVFLVVIAVLVVAQIVGRLIGVQIPGANEFAGYSLAATSFLGLAYSFRQGAHIRVTLLTDQLPQAMRRWVLVMALALASSMVIYLAYNTMVMVYLSWDFGEMSSGIISYPLWIPQLSMAIGMVLFSMALIEDLVRTLLGMSPNFEKNKESLGVD
ncbi:TRAP transporter small permease [Halomonas faecis]|uniref:TRAP transporter small permease n=1 Tax=Halomonas faecis TaxID=1562110 RepID=UPI0013D35ADD|nr:TRAP transporter small permease [Halomonas faecis]